MTNSPDNPSTKGPPCPQCGADLGRADEPCTLCGWGKAETPNWRGKLSQGIQVALGIASVAAMAYFGWQKVQKTQEVERVLAQGGKEEDIELLERAFEALHDRSYDSFARLSITPGDFVARNQVKGLSTMHERATGREMGMVGQAMAAQQTFAGSVLAQEEKEAQRTAFEQATKGCATCIDFASSAFRGVASMTPTSYELLDGETLSVRVYSLRFQASSGDGEAQGTAPLFAVADWGGTPKLLGLWRDPKGPPATEPPPSESPPPHDPTIRSRRH